MLNVIKNFLSPVPFVQTGMVVYEGESEQTLKAQLEKLKHDIKYVREAMAKEQTFRDDMFEEISPNLYDLIEKLDFLKGKHEAYLYEAKTQVQQGTFRVDDLHDFDLGEGSDKDFVQGNAEDETPDTVNRNTRKACSRLYKKISNMTHPDKNGGSDILNDIFYAATEAYIAHDLQQLEEIWEDLAGSKSKIKSKAAKSKQRLLRLIEEYKKVYASVEQEWQGFMQTEDAILSSIYRKSGATATTAAYRRMLNISIEEYEQAIANLRQASSDKNKFTDIDITSEASRELDGDDDDWDWEGDFEPNISEPNECENLDDDDYE